MSSHEKHRKPERSREKREEEEAPSSGETVANSPFRSASTEKMGPRIWVLPTATGNAWAIAEEADSKRLSEQLCEKPPTVLSMRVSKEEQPEALRFAGDSIEAKFRERS